MLKDKLYMVSIRKINDSPQFIMPYFLFNYVIKISTPENIKTVMKNLGLLNETQNFSLKYNEIDITSMADFKSRNKDYFKKVSNALRKCIFFSSREQRWVYQPNDEPNYTLFNYIFDTKINVLVEPTIPKNLFNTINNMIYDTYFVSDDNVRHSIYPLKNKNGMVDMDTLISLNNDELKVLILSKDTKFSEVSMIAKTLSQVKLNLNVYFISDDDELYILQNPKVSLGNMINIIKK